MPLSPKETGDNLAAVDGRDTTDVRILLLIYGGLF